MTGLAQGLFPAAANGSLIERDGAVIGSTLIGQPFTGAAWLQPRPSASGWNAAGTGASNLGADLGRADGRSAGAARGLGSGERHAGADRRGHHLGLGPRS